MNYKLLYKRLLQLITQPVNFWQLVKEEETRVSEVRLSVLLPAIILIAIASFIGIYLFSYNSLSIVYPILKAIEYFLIFLLTVEASFLVLNEITLYIFRSRISNSLYKLIVYSLIPFMLLMIITRVFSSLLFLNLGGLFGLYILWKGIDIMIGGEYKFRIRLFILFSLNILVFYLGIRWIIDSLTEGLYLTIFG